MPRQNKKSTDDFFDFLFKAGVATGLAYLGVKAYNKITGSPDDNPVEEKTEDFLKANFGVSVDLTPDSPESLDQRLAKINQTRRG